MSSREDRGTEIERLAREAAEPLGLEVVEIVVRRQGRHSLLRVDIDRPGVPGVGIDDCERMSRALEVLLDEAALMGETPYDLQVSSPGLDRPIRTRDDVRRNVGRRVVVETREAVAGLRVIVGTLAGGDERSLRVRTDDGRDVEIPAAAVEKAHQEIDFSGGPRRGTRR